MKGPPNGEYSNRTEMKSPQHFWYRRLYLLNEELSLGLNFSHWETIGRPNLGMYSLPREMKGRLKRTKSEEEAAIKRV